MVDGESIIASTHINHVLTVQELVDIVHHLQPLYDVTPPKHNPYRYVYSLVGPGPSP